jgi:hypothetical protein
MKKRITILFFILSIVSSLIVISSAHSGRTDYKGGHYDRDTGKYHYHHGHSAHEHYDMDGDNIADCPYGFEDNDTKKSSNIELIAKIVAYSIGCSLFALYTVGILIDKGISWLFEKSKNEKLRNIETIYLTLAIIFITVTAITIAYVLKSEGIL